MPAFGLDKKRQPKPPVDFTKWHTEKSQWIESDNRQEQWQRWRKWQEVHKFFVGEQLIWWDGTLESGYWKDAEIEEGDPYYASNLTAPYTNAIIAELYRSNGELLVAAKTDQWKNVNGAQAFKAALTEEERRLWTDEMILRALFFYCIYGNTLWYTFWDKDAGPDVDIPQFQNQQMPFGTQFGTCASCGQQSEVPPAQPGTPPMPPTCQGCGSSAMMVQGNNSPIQMPQFGQPQKQPGGQVGLLIADPTLIKMHLHSRWIGETPYLKYSPWLLRDEAQMKYPDANFDSNRGTGDQARMIERENELHPGNMTGMGAFGSHEMRVRMGQSDSNMVRIDYTWLRPSQYWEVITTEPVELESDTIPANTAWREVFPKGMLQVKSGDEVIDMDEAIIEKSWVHARYQTIPTRIWGDGMEGLIQKNREYNELRSVELENAFHNATPATYINTRKVKSGVVSGRARQLINVENMAKDDRIDNVVYTPPPRSLGGDIPMMKSNIKGDMQLESGAPIAESGIEGAATNTATGMQIVRDWTNSKLAIRIGPYNAAKVARAEQNGALIQQYWVGDRYVKLSNQTGIEDGQWFENSDVQGDYDVTLKPGSWQPRSAMEIKDNMLQLLVAGGVPMGIFNPGFPKQAATVLTRELGFPMDIDGYSIHVRKQREEIEDIKQAEGIGAQYGAMPGMLSGQAVPVEENDDDQAHIDTCYYYLNTDMGKRETPEIKAAILNHVHAHMQGMQMKAMQQAAMMQPLAMMQSGAPHGQPPGQGKGQPPGQDKGQPPANQGANQGGPPPGM